MENKDMQKKLLSDLMNCYDLKKIQEYLKKILKIRGFNTQTPQDKIVLLIEEIGELAKAVRKDTQSMTIDRNKISNYQTVESEVADVFIVLISLCNVLDIDIYDVFIEKEKENIERVWD